MKNRNYGMLPAVQHYAPMASPEILLDAAKPGPPLNEKEIEKKNNEYEKRFAWGFKGTHTLPPDYQSKSGRIVHTPSHWRRVGIEQTGETFTLVHLVSRVQFTKTDLEMAQHKEAVEGLTLAQALETGGAIEQSMQRLLPLRKRE